MEEHAPQPYIAPWHPLQPNVRDRLRNWPPGQPEREPEPGERRIMEPEPEPRYGPIRIRTRGGATGGHSNPEEARAYAEEERRAANARRRAQLAAVMALQQARAEAARQAAIVAHRGAEAAREAAIVSHRGIARLQEMIAQCDTDAAAPAEEARPAAIARRSPQLESASDAAAQAIGLSALD